jgi:hypothetical protein
MTLDFKPLIYNRHLRLDFFGKIYFHYSIARKVDTQREAAYGIENGKDGYPGRL